MLKLLYISLGGIAGTLLRYYTSGLVNNILGLSFPYGTFAVNISGSFLIGLLWGLSDLLALSPNLRLFLFIGFLGSFTTFSTFALESMNYFRDGNTRVAVLNILLSNLAGILFVFLGYFLSRLFINPNA